MANCFFEIPAVRIIRIERRADTRRPAHDDREYAGQHKEGRQRGGRQTANHRPAERRGLFAAFAETERQLEKALKAIQRKAKTRRLSPRARQ